MVNNFDPWAGMLPNSDLQFPFRPENVTDPNAKPSNPKELQNKQVEQQVSMAASGQIKPNSPYEAMQANLDIGEPGSEEEALQFMNMSRPEQTQYLIGKQLSSFDAYADNIKGLEAEIGKIESAEQPVNYQALMMLTDQWTGSNFSKLYKPPQTPEEKRALVMKLKQAVNNQRIGLSNAQTGMLKQLMKQEKEPELNKKDTFEMRRKFTSTDQFKNIDKIYNLQSTIDSVDNKLQDFKLEDLKGQKGKELASAYRQLLLKYNADVGKLGALAGADLTQLETILSDPTSLKNWASAKVFGHNPVETLKNVVKEMRAHVAEEAQENSRTLTDAYGDYNNSLGSSFESVGRKLKRITSKVGEEKERKKFKPMNLDEFISSGALNTYSGRKI